MMSISHILLFLGCTVAQDIYEGDVGVANGRRFWYPEWRMKDLLQDTIMDVSQEQRSLEQKIDVDRDTEFYLTDAEIEEVLHPKLKSSLSLERRIEQVLGMRSYDDYDEEDYGEEEEVQDAILHKGQQRQLPRKNNNLFKKDGRNKRGGGGRNNNKTGKRGGGRGNNANNKRGKRGNNKRGKRGGNKHQVFKYTNKQYKNICLDPPDR